MVAVVLGAAAACGLDSGPTDEELHSSVRSALESASDVNADQLEVDVTDGVVRISGSLTCETCGGQRTPAAEGSIQQTIGAVVRAVPGVVRIEFDLLEP